MRILTRTLLSALLFISASTAAQNRTVPSPAVPILQSPGSMIRTGWVSPVYNKLKWVPDPNSVTTVDVEPERREAGYWPDMHGGSSQQSGVVLLHFVQGTTVFAKGQDNDRAFAILEHTFYNTALVAQMEFVTVTAASSPEGMTEDNETLAANRALAIKEHILTMFPYLERDRIVTYSAGEDWNGLKRLIEEDLYTPGRDAALRLLGAPLSGNILRERLQQISGGETYKYISEHMFPKLRGGAACLIYFKPSVQMQDPVPAQPVTLPVPAVSPTQQYIPVQQPIQQPQPVYYAPPTIPAQQPAPVYQLPAPQPEPQQSASVVTLVPQQAVAEQQRYVSSEWLKEPFVDLKTNLLYDLTATVNLALEFRLSRKLSLDIPVNYNGWNWSGEKMWRHVLVQPELRLWVKSSGAGHFFGLHGLYGYFNIAGIGKDKNGDPHRYEGTLLAGLGVSYGYRWNFRNPRWGMEATVGAGFADFRYNEYLCELCGNDAPIAKDAKKMWVGPTKVGLSLIYRLGGERY